MYYIPRYFYLCNNTKLWTKKQKNNGKHNFSFQNFEVIPTHNILINVHINDITSLTQKNSSIHWQQNKETPLRL